MIQRWLVIFAREHLPDICEKLMAVTDPAADRLGAAPLRVLPRQLLPSRADRPETLHEFKDDSITFFILDSLRRVLTVMTPPV